VLSYGKYGITKACTDLKAAAIMLDYITSEEYHILTEWGIEGQTFEYIDGIPTYKEGIGQSYWEQMASNGLTTGFWLFGMGIFPRMNLGQNLNVTEAGAAEYKLSYMDTFPKDPITGGTETTYLAMPSADELDRISEIRSDLNTYSSETLTKLILEQLSLDDWDTYISELKALGLDELIEIQTNRYERYLGA
jgi:hypothetical protein